MRQQIEHSWNMQALDVYGLSEIIGPGVSQECTHKCGLHLQWDVFYPEVIDPKTGELTARGRERERMGREARAKDRLASQTGHNPEHLVYDRRLGKAFVK